jgi:hypothetical protein
VVQAESAVVMLASQTALCLGRMLSGVTREAGWVVLEVLVMPAGFEMLLLLSLIFPSVA